MEILHLNGIPNKDLPLRAAQLHYLAGWSFAAISRALDGRITARALRYMTAAYTPDFLPPPPTKRFPLPQAPEVRPVLSARHKELLSATEESTIAELAPIARRYRASMSPEHAAAYANRDLTTLVLDCYARGVSISDLARAAGVSHRAMAKRLGKP
jgi:hypothetical protein